ncbi:glucose-1-phosphate thymidylyltransferase [Streptomyces olivoverticillatus]|uniref:Glucose-1-phosphate thymidylyltransferase n=1 Tax=Streptomyces olivoverticillatus TaxID=66427 RepID=A0A7W7LNL6_9ACTN|nr:glucose-1-phosphate thymidylyltransferase [Streptomyces olivoverticillatus]MBB4893137.1 glucose-1-phosphate thymidylyltransferase [Streptomyces olivoverticillatus]
MKALVLSGGSGTRLRPFTHSMPKQLIPIANKPVLEHVLASVGSLGVTEVGVVVGDRGRQIADVLGDGSRFGLRLTFIEQDEPRGLAHAVAVARDFLGDDDFVMYLGDNMLPDGIAEMAEQFTAHRPATQVVVHKVEDPRCFGVAEIDPDGRVLQLVEKPLEPRSDLAVIGVYFFTPAIHEAVAAIEPSARGELEITDAIQWLVEAGADVRAAEYGGYWKDTGHAEHVLDCNRRLLDGITHSVTGDVDAASELIGPVVVEQGARVTASRIEGPVIVGAGSVIENSHLGPYTSIGRDNVLRGAGIAHSITLDGARVSHVRGLHGSLIGRFATIGACDGGSTHRLVVGDDTFVEVAV